MTDSVRCGFGLARNEDGDAMTTVDDLRGHIQQWDQGAWCLAALVITRAAERDGAQARAARHLGCR